MGLQNNHSTVFTAKYQRYVLDNYNVFMLDIGSNIGACTFEMYSQNYYNLNMISFEPSHTNLYYLKNKKYFLFEGGVTHFNDTEMDRNIPFKVLKLTMVTGNAGQTHFGNRRRMQTQSMTQMSINLTSVDYVFNYLLTKYSNIYDINKLIIPFIKVDTEGFEYNVLLSAIKLI